MFTLTDYDYSLPEALVAQSPVSHRADSRLLKLERHTGAVSHHAFNTVGDFFEPGDVLVINNTRVVPGRLLGRKTTGGKVEVLILDYAGGSAILEQTGQFEGHCLIKASKSPKPGTQLVFANGLAAEVVSVLDGMYTVRFHCDGDFHATIQEIGRVPLPPYIKRPPEDSDAEDRQSYQTVYASRAGAIAAPTAGLHFTTDLLHDLQSKGVVVVQLTLHVGYGTFLPVRVDDIREHRMHAERFTLAPDAAETINRAKKNRSRIVAVGTTSVRSIEFVANRYGRVSAASGQCDLFIYPGYRFKVIDAMITNFHLPKSTLMMLVSAFAGRENILAAYETAIQERYRFYSYGDAMLIM